ncbi:MAG: sulfotransferase [Gammaproteobacteria bacterium]|nr:sulfotransferase [Gammaproteobacteria bacterium]
MSEASREQVSLGSFRPYRPRSIKLLNRLGEIGRSIGLNTAINVSKLLDGARSKTGLNDFDGEYAIEALKVLVGSINEEARLTPIGRLIQSRRLLNALIARSKIRDFLSKNQLGSDCRLNQVLLITGLQRTGTTLLQRLIASHSQFRGITAAAAFDPVAAATDRAKDTRAANRQAQLYENALSYLAPDFRKIHPVEMSAPEEDVLLLDLNFMSQAPEAMMRVPSYSSWLEQQDHGPAYAHFRTTLEILQASDPQKHWVLKSPHHLEYLDVVLEQFPDATIIQTHRDPRRTIPSFCSMVAHSFGIFSDHIDTNEIAAHWVRKVKRMLQKSRDVRASNPDRFYDISYYDLTERPLDVLAGLWKRMGMEFGDAERKSAAQCLDENPKDRFGRHEYLLSDFKLDVCAIDREFEPYRTAFDIPVES